MENTSGKRQWRKPSDDDVDLNSGSRRESPRRGRDADPIDKQGMTRSMQKRIARARAQGERQERNRLAAERAADQKEISDLRLQMHQIKVQGQVSTEEAKHDAEMKQLEQSLEQAHRDGNAAEITKLTRQIQAKESAWLERKRAILNTPVNEPSRAAKTEQGPAPEGRAWIEANSDWYDKPGYEAETAATIAIDRKLLSEGSDPNSPEHYKAIQRELSKKFRSLEVLDPSGKALEEDEDEDKGRGKGKRKKGRERDRLRDEDEDEDLDDDSDEDEDQDEDDDDDRGDQDADDEDDDDDPDDEDDDDAEARRRRKPPFMNMGESGGGSRRNNGIRRRGGKIVLTEKIRRDMVKFGMDPEKDDHVEAYARELNSEGDDE